ncbi:MAG: SLBB domain-containing protein, partial [Gemmatimonadetes bacterium]|nr:SLBB domain-containing protein [Gemmatimonadota bacterium]
MKLAAPLVLAIAFSAPALRAQQAGGAIPGGLTPEQAVTLVQQNPSLGPVIQQQLSSSGLSPEEIRARLAAAGYPPTALDAFIKRDTTGLPFAGEQTLAALRALRLTSFVTRDSILLYGDSLAVHRMRDSVRIDSIVRTELQRRMDLRLDVFGLDAFRRPTTEYRALASGPVDQNYRLGPGDGLVLVLTGEIETAYQLDVTREGSIFVPDVGQIYVNNLSMEQLRGVLFTRLGRVYSGLTRRPDSRTKFDVTVSKVRAIAVRVIGEVARPGAYLVGATGGVLNALYEAGGLTERANFRDIKILRGADSIGTVDVYRYLLTGSVPTDIRLTAGDVVFVPVHGPRVKITGEVMRPAVYELQPGEGLRELFQLAGGLTPRASTGNVTIDRILPPSQRTVPGREHTVLSVSVLAALDSTRPSIPLYAEDSIMVLPVRGGRTGSVTIAGSVWQPGTYRLDPGLRLWDLIRMAGGLRPETYAGRAQIVRSLPDSTRRMLGAVLDSTNASSNLPLAELDNVTIYPRTEFRPERYVSVYGSVRKPGVVAFSDSMTLRDALLLAGGTTEDAYLAQAEVSRVRLDGTGDGDSTAVVLKAPLDSSYVLDATGYVRRPVGSSDAPVVALEPYDAIFIRRQPGLESPRLIVLSGEVKFPGRYTLLTKDERLTDLIERAGGLTPRAYANGIRFFRREYEHPKGKGLQNQTESRALERNVFETDPGLTRIGVNLERVLRDARYQDNLALAAGDSIHIPRFLPVVLVEGGVNAPTAVTYVPGRGRDYYVDAAGGFARLADKKGTYVEQPNGIIEKKGKPQPGAVVVVPVRESPVPNQFALPAILGLIGQLAGG